MQELILIISKCLSKKKNKGSIHTYHFHFKGYYLGQKIKVIHLYASELNNNTREQLSKGNDYLLWVKRRGIFQEILEVELIKYKKIM